MPKRSPETIGCTRLGDDKAEALGVSEYSFHSLAPAGNMPILSMQIIQPSAVAGVRGKDRVYS
jgi:hypothetical protein